MGVAKAMGPVPLVGLATAMGRVPLADVATAMDDVPLMNAASATGGVLLVDVAKAMGGVETRVVATAEGLHARGITVRVACLRDSPVAVALHERGVPVESLARSKWDPRLLLALRRTLRSRRGWVVDCHNAPSQLGVHLAGIRMGPHARGGGGRVATIHSEYRSSEQRRWGFSWAEAVLRWTIRAGWAIVPVSTSVQRHLATLGVPTDRMQIVWSGASGPQSTRTRAAVRQELGLDETDFVAVAVGRLVPVKNFEMAIEAIALLHETVPSARLVIVGEGPERNRLEQIAAGRGRGAGLVRFVGHRLDVPDLVAAADVLVITSTTEGLPYVLLEAAVARVPVVSTSVGAIPEVFPDGAVVLLPPEAQLRPEGARLLARELAALARRPDRRRLLASRAAAIQHHRLSLDSMMRATLSTYSRSADVLGANAPSAGAPSAGALGANAPSANALSAGDLGAGALSTYALSADAPSAGALSADALSAHALSPAALSVDGREPRRQGSAPR